MNKFILIEELTRIHELMGVKPKSILIMEQGPIGGIGEAIVKALEKMAEKVGFVSTESTLNFIYKQLEKTLEKTQKEALERIIKSTETYEQKIASIGKTLESEGEELLQKTRNKLEKQYAEFADNFADSWLSIADNLNMFDNMFEQTLSTFENSPEGIELAKKTFKTILENGGFNSRVIDKYLKNYGDKIIEKSGKKTSPNPEVPKTEPEVLKPILPVIPVNTVTPITPQEFKIESGSVYKVTKETLGVQQYKKFRTNKVYFNHVEKVENETTLPGKVKIIDNDNNEFIFDLSDLKTTKDSFNTSKNNISVDKQKFDIVKPAEFEFKTNPIKGSNIIKGLEKAFPNNWYKPDGKFTAGLRNIFPIKNYIKGEKSNWSVLNWLDTRQQSKNKLYEQYKKSNSKKEFDDWFAEFLNSKNSEDIAFLDRLCKEQAKSIESGINTELKFVRAFKKIKNPSSIDLSEFGTIKDRFLGIDVTIDGVTYQIKPATSKLIVTKNSYQIYTNKKILNYNTKNVNKIAFVNNSAKEIYIFDNVDVVVSGNVVTFKNKPEIIKM